MSSARVFHKNFVGRYYEADVVGRTIYVEKPPQGDYTAMKNELRHFAGVETDHPDDMVSVRETVGNKIAVEFVATGEE